MTQSQVVRRIETLTEEQWRRAEPYLEADLDAAEGDASDSLRTPSSWAGRARGRSLCWTTTRCSRWRDTRRAGVIRWSRAAAVQLFAAGDRARRHRPGADERLYAATRKITEMIVEQPRIFAKVDEVRDGEVRRALVMSFGYWVIYEVLEAQRECVVLSFWSTGGIPRAGGGRRYSRRPRSRARQRASTCPARDPRRPSRPAGGSTAATAIGSAHLKQLDNPSAASGPGVVLCASTTGGTLGTGRGPQLDHEFLDPPARHGDGRVALARMSSVTGSSSTSPSRKRPTTGPASSDIPPPTAATRPPRSGRSAAASKPESPSARDAPGTRSVDAGSTKGPSGPGPRRRRRLDGLRPALRRFVGTSAAGGVARLTVTGCGGGAQEASDASRRSRAGALPGGGAYVWSVRRATTGRRPPYAGGGAFRRGAASPGRNGRALRRTAAVPCTTTSSPGQPQRSWEHTQGRGSSSPPVRMRFPPKPVQLRRRPVQLCIEHARLHR